MHSLSEESGGREGGRGRVGEALTPAVVSDGDLRGRSEWERDLGVRCGEASPLSTDTLRVL